LTAHFHLPGLFEFYEFYKVFLPIFYEHRDYFYDWCDIGSIYGAPADCIWGGGRVGYGEDEAEAVISLIKEYGISSRLTFSNSLIQEEHLSDKKCNELCRMFNTGSAETDILVEIDASAESYNVKNSESITDYSSKNGYGQNSGSSINGDSEEKNDVENGIIVHSDLLLEYIKQKYNGFYFVSSTTKVITDFDEFVKELNRDEFEYVVPDFRLNKRIEELSTLAEKQKNKVEFLVNECCNFYCKDRKACYENVSHKALGDSVPDHICKSDLAAEGYVFSKAMKNSGFIGIDDIQNVYMPLGFSNFKIEGRSLGSAMILEFLLYYMTKPEYQLNVREKIYLSASLDLF